MRKIDRSYEAHQVQLGTLRYSKDAALRKCHDPEFLIGLGLGPLIGKQASNPKKAILEQFDITIKQLRRQGFIDLVASFESDLFGLVRQSTSHARDVLKQHYDQRKPFGQIPEDLARTGDDFSNLGGYKKLLMIDNNKSDRRRPLWNVISYRDYLAHGQRWQTNIDHISVDDAYAVLTAEMNWVEVKTA